LQVNKLLKVNTHQLIGIDLNLRSTDPETDKLTTQP